MNVDDHMSNNDHLEILGSRNVIPMILFIRETDGCRKTDIYQNVSRNAKMPDYIRSLQEIGIVEISEGNGFSVINLTDKGKTIADLLEQISDLI